MKDKPAKFFCENCGAEVPQNAKFCKKCGRFFTSVKCPRCSYTGPVSAFIDGCPNCGYAEREKNSMLHHISFFSASYFKKRKKSEPDNTLPVWIYIITAGILAVVLIALLKLYMS
jgi:predicted RNA-binding Zn-ribbon protein involved in translation (DUF1610 family)